MNSDEIGRRWLQRSLFLQPMIIQLVDNRLLVLDGQGSHWSLQFDLICEENGIITICMLAYLSHLLLQPLDVGCFGPPIVI
jgi:hypothetical protein